MKKNAQSEKKQTKPVEDEIKQDAELYDPRLNKLLLEKKVLEKQFKLKVSWILGVTFLCSVLFWLLYDLTFFGVLISDVLFKGMYLSSFGFILLLWSVASVYLAKEIYGYLIQSSGLGTEIELSQKREKVDKQLGYSIIETEKPKNEKQNQLPSNAEITPTSYFNSLVRINIDNLDGYYILVKAHAQNSYTASIFAGIAGFLFILIGLSIGLLGDSDTKTLAFVSSGAGIAIEFISSIFFYLYNKTIRELREYHNSLISVQNILLSFKIVEETKDEKQKAQMMSQMISFMIGKSLLKETEK